MSSNHICNLDANSAAPMSAPALSAWVAAASQPDRERAHAAALTFARALAAEYSFELLPEGADTPLPPGANLHDDPSYSVTWVGGAAEANCAVITGAVRRYTVATKRLPHLVTTAGDPPSVLACCRALHAERACELTVLPIRRNGAGLGALDPAFLKRALRANTCLVSIAAVNSDTGAINILRRLAEEARRANVPFHSDVTLLIGRSAFHPAALGLDAWTASFGHLGGAPQLAALVARRSFVHGYRIASYFGGASSPAGELRATAAGDPDAVTQMEPAIAATAIAWQRAIEIKRAAAQTRPRDLRALLWARLSQVCRPIFIDDCDADVPPSVDGGISPPGKRPHLGTPEGRDALSAAAIDAGAPAMVWIAPRDLRGLLPNTMLISICRLGFSAEPVRAQLRKESILVGRPRAATVAALGLPAVLRAGLLRFSFHADCTEEDIIVAADRISAMIGGHPSGTPPGGHPQPRSGTPRPRSSERPRSSDRPSGTPRPRSTERPRSSDRPSGTPRPRSSERPRSSDRPRQ
jgi:cysteine sulfinate desulfinase/cysteine desulfurase-like protein